ncbi:MAG TPA: hypothetical protein VHM47_05505 [Actinomycetota bacterium]|jgi:hypothetical protein|nr:hypothetical protein [Actinomycetota bacterium]
MNCEHMGCMCLVEPGQDFCSDHCRQHASDPTHEEHRCECGHPACSMAGV